jgi:hypothetical protein
MTPLQSSSRPLHTSMPLRAQRHSVPIGGVAAQSHSGPGRQSARVVQDVAQTESTQ